MTISRKLTLSVEWNVFTFTRTALFGERGPRILHCRGTEKQHGVQFFHLICYGPRAPLNETILRPASISRLAGAGGGGKILLYLRQPAVTMN